MRSRIVILMGGPSGEHEVSLKSGAAMSAAINRSAYEVVDVIIDKSGHWNLPDAPHSPLDKALRWLEEYAPDMVLLGLHGTFGEDGTLQALLERKGIPYTGSSSAASMVAMDKVASNALYAYDGLRVPMTTVVYGDDDLPSVLEGMDYPVIVKPSRQGSSVGVHVVDSQDQLHDAMVAALRFDQHILIQEFITGREVSCGVLDDPATKTLTALPPTELIPTNARFFDYDAKYTPGGAKEVTPPENMPEETLATIQDIAKRAHVLLGCSDMSRTDVIVDHIGQIFVIETNTLPGMTETSILPQQAAAAGMSFAQLVERIISSALYRKNQI